MRGDVESTRGTWWSLFNSVTNFVDHAGKFKGDSDKKAESRFDKVMEGPGAAFKNDAWKLALEMAA